MRVLGINYRKAPETSFPVPVEDCLTAYKWLQKVEETIILTGISAGSSLVLDTLVSIKQNNLKYPVEGVCMSPLADFTFQSESLETNAKKDWIYRERLESVRDLYLAGEDPKNPFAFPMFADLKGFPPLFLQAGDAEILRDDSKRFAKKAEDDGVSVKLEVWEDMVHCWKIFASKIPEGNKAVEHIGKFISEI